jgi:hypothetical protein
MAHSAPFLGTPSCQPTSCSVYWRQYDRSTISPHKGMCLPGYCVCAITLMRGIFSSSNLSSIHNSQYRTFHHQNLTIPKSPPVPAQVVLPKLFNSFDCLFSMRDTLLFTSISISYKPLIALFKMMNMKYPATNLTGLSALWVFMTYVIVNIHPSIHVFRTQSNYAGFDTQTRRTLHSFG